MEDCNLLELLDTYIEMVEKQDEIISRLGKIIARQATELKHYENVNKFINGDEINKVNNDEDYRYW